MSALVDHALRYASDLGWKIFPLAPNGKLPLLSKEQGGRGCLDATDDTTIIRNWWGRAPKANIGLACGVASGIWVLDIDVDKGGDKSLAELEHHHGRLPQTCSVVTGSGGRHFYWSLPNDDVKVRNRAGVWPGVDTRCNHGYVVAPPSVHPNGTLYEWASSEHLKPVDAPEWLVRGVTAVKQTQHVATGPAVAIPRDRAISRARSYLARMPESVSGDGGHQRLWAAAITLVVGFNLPPDVALSILRSDFNPRCKPAWSEKELAHKVEDATRAQLVPGYMLQREPERAGSAEPVINPESFFLGKMFMQHGWLGQLIRPGVWAAMCPTRVLHTSGDDMDSSTMIFAPNGPGRPGFFKCAHVECDGIYRDCSDVVNALLREERCPA